MQHPDSLRRVLDSVFRAPAYRWSTETDPFAIVRRWWREFLEWFHALQESSPVGYQVVMYLLVAVVVLFAIRALWVLYHQVAAPMIDPPGNSDDPAAPRTVTWFQRESDRLAHQGRYAEAIQADFLALVLVLDARKVLRFHPSKTPAEYARESSLSPGAAADFGELVHRVYGYAFARWPCGPEEFAEWRAQANPERYAAAH